jgi:glycosyltransferase involved in cell wall biosynthesis
MRVLIVPSWYPTDLKPIGGIFFKEQAQALQKSRHKVTVAFPELWSVKTFSKQKHHSGISFEVEDGIKTYRSRGYNYLPRVPYVAGLIYYRRLKKLFEKIVKEQGEPDIIHAHSCLWGGWAAAKLAKKRNVPLVITEHSTAFARDLIKPYQKRGIVKTLEASKKIIVVGPGLERKLSRYVSHHKITLIPNIVNTEYFRPNSSNSSENNRFRFFSVGFLNPKKGMDILLKAFAKSFKEENVELVIGGDGRERSNLEQLTRDLDIKSQVQFLGELSRKEVRQQMQQSDAFVLASRYETFGVVFIEALACGKPVVATKCDGPESIVNEKNGLIVPVENIKALSESMEKIVNSIEDYNSDLIRDDCLKRFSEKAVITQIGNVYSKSLM